MTNQCTPAMTVPAFSTHLSEGSRLMESTDDKKVHCSDSLKNPDKTNCENFTKWTQYTASICGALGLAAQFVQKAVTDQKISIAIVMSLETAYDGISGVNEQFMEAIADINEGKPYAPVPEPDTIPPFPKPTGGNDVEQAVVSAWDMLKPWVVQAMAKMPSGSPWIKVLQGMIESSDAMVKDLQQLFSEVEA